MELPEKIGPYRILAPLGAGGMGVVYRGEHVESGSERAIKTVRVPYGSELAGLRCEIHALTRISHPGIVRIVGEGLENGLPWYAMELLEGGTLEDYIARLWNRAKVQSTTQSDVNETVEADAVNPEVWKLATVSSGKPLPGGGFAAGGAPASARARVQASGGKLVETLTLLRRLCTPLAFLHGSGIVHRDLKPANVFIRADGTPVLVDFGLVSRAEGAGGREVIEVAGDIMGTTSYMSPEQIKGQLVDPRSDLYALGCMLYETITGRVPFVGEPFQVMMQHVTKPPIPPSELADGVPRELDELVLSLLQKEPRKRLGHADDVAAILGELGAEDSPQMGERPRDYLYRPELAGRQEILAQFSAYVTAARGGAGRAVLVGGESGVGKTYLAAAVARDARLAEMRVVTGECMPVATPEGGVVDVRSAPLHPFRRLFEAIADLAREKGVEVADRILGAHGKILAAYEPALASLPGQDAYPEPAEVPAQAARRRILHALEETLAAFAREKPLLLIIDDLQWADELSLSFFGGLSDGWFADKSLLILGTYRSEEMHEGLGEVVDAPGVSRVQLGRLDENTVGQIVGDMLAMPKPPTELVRVLVRRSSGNPFFVAEFLRTAVAEQLLYRERGQWRISSEGRATEATYDALPLPGSLRELVGRRLAGLSPEAHALVQAAAVLGREVDAEVLQAVAGFAESEALAAVKELLGRQVLEEVRAGRLRFVHDKLREIAYEHLDDARRRELHRGAALALEKRFSDSTTFSLLYSELAHHFTESGDLLKAIDYLEKAGEQAQHSFANREAARFFSDALALDDQLGHKIPTLRRARWERHAGNALLNQGKLVESQGHLHQAVALLGWRMPAQTWRLIASFLGHIVRQVVHQLRQPPSERDPERRALLVEAVRAYDLLMPVTYFVTGNILRILYASLANLNLAELAGPSPELALAYANAHVTTGLIPWPSLAEKYGKSAHRVLEGVSDPAVRSWVYILTGSYAIGAGRWKEAIDFGEKSFAIAEDVGFRRRVEEAQGILGTAYFLSGDFVRARDTSQRTYDSGQRGDPQTQVWGAAGVAQACSYLGEHERALHNGDLAEKLLEHDLGRPEKIIAYGVLAQACLRSGDKVRARKIAELGAQAISEGTPTAFYCIGAYSFVAEVFLALWQEAAPLDRPPLARLARRSCKDVWQSAKVFPSHRPRALLLDGRAAALDGRSGRARKRYEESLEAARKLDMIYDEGLAVFALAQLGDRSDPARRENLLRAKELFTRSGGRYDLGLVEAELSAGHSGAAG